MPTGDSNPSNKRKTRPEPANRDPQAADESVQPVPSKPDESVDFGSYVSSTVRSSAELFGTPARSAPSRKRASRSDTPSSSQPANDPPPARSEAPSGRRVRNAPVTSTNKPRTYWRDSVAGETVDDADIDNDSGRGGSGRSREMFPWKFPEDDRTRKIIVAAVAVALLALVALIWFLSRGGDDGDPPPPTGTVESVIDAAPSATEAEDDSRTPPAFLPSADEETPTPAPTDTVRRGCFLIS